jgi:Calx-beta domain/Bacterial cadherin-like domain
MFQASATAQILADDGLTVRVDDVVVAEGASGTTTATFTVRLSAAPGQTVTVDYASADGSATAGSDYTAVADTLTFGPTETVKTVTVTVAGDLEPEGDETFSLLLSNAVGALIADGAAVGTVSNDDTLPAVSVTAPDASAAEGLPPGAALFRLSRTGFLTESLTVSYSLGGTGSVPEVDVPYGDFWLPPEGAPSGTVTFAPGQTFLDLPLIPLDDALAEAAETLVLTVTPRPGYVVAPSGSATLTITDDDSAGAGNQGPDAVDDRVLLAINTTVSFPVLANDLDADSDPLTITSFTPPAHGTVEAGPDGALTYPSPP